MYDPAAKDEFRVVWETIKKNEGPIDAKLVIDAIKRGGDVNWRWPIQVCISFFFFVKYFH